MSKQKRVYLDRMLEAIGQIEKYTFSMSYQKFRSERMISDACLMQFQFLGETASKLRENFPDENSLPLRDMVDFRNFIAHEYLWIDLMDVWDTIQVDLPRLRLIINEID